MVRTRKKFNIPNTRRAPRWKVSRKIYEKEMEQAHILLGFPSTSFQDKYRFEAFIINSLLGGGMTSRLYQAVREKNGLAYTVYSSLNTNIDSGNITIQASTDSKKIKKVMHIIADELIKLKKEGFKKSDVDLFKKQVRGQLLMGSDDIENRMSSLGVNEMVFNSYKSVEEIIQKVEAVTEKSIKTYIREHFDLSKISVALMGPKLSQHKEWLENYDFTKRRSK